MWMFCVPSVSSNNFNIHLWALFESIITLVIAKCYCFSNFIISSIFILHYSLKNFSSCWLLEYWYGFMGYFLIQCAIIHYCHYSFLCSNYSKLAISFKLSSVFFWHVFTSLARHPCFLAQQIWDNWENLNIANILDITVLNSWEWSWHCGSCT